MDSSTVPVPSSMQVRSCFDKDPIGVDNEFLLIIGDSDEGEPNVELGDIRGVKLPTDNFPFLMLSNNSSLSGNDILFPITFDEYDFIRKLVWGFGLEPNG